MQSDFILKRWAPININQLAHHSTWPHTTDNHKDNQNHRPWDIMADHWLQTTNRVIRSVMTLRFSLKSKGMSDAQAPWNIIYIKCVRHEKISWHLRYRAYLMQAGLFKDKVSKELKILPSCPSDVDTVGWQSVCSGRGIVLLSLFITSPILNWHTSHLPAYSWYTLYLLVSLRELHVQIPEHAGNQ